jgi:hypothetical protein
VNASEKNCIGLRRFPDGYFLSFRSNHKDRYCNLLFLAHDLLAATAAFEGADLAALHGAPNVARR